MDLSLLKPFLPHFLIHWRRQYRRSIHIKKEINAWVIQGKPLPPPYAIKQKTINDYRKKYKCNILIETGTYEGEMVETQKHRFKKVFSIELSNVLYEKAKVRFENDKNVLIIQGDSGNILSSILKNVQGSLLFWLDGHYSGGKTAKGKKYCPILEELEAIFNFRGNKIILIDDAKDFNGQNDYPTIQYLTNYIHKKDPGYSIEVKDNIIRCII